MKFMCSACDIRTLFRHILNLKGRISDNLVENLVPGLPQINDNLLAGLYYRAGHQSKPCAALYCSRLQILTAQSFDILPSLSARYHRKQVVVKAQQW
ncbi:MAG: hypothetical protein HRU23_14560 [Gammaproteobacteria bacterium]|nr:hypothetical protein [Gammaproteobacteria bacterium]